MGEKGDETRGPYVSQIREASEHHYELGRQETPQVGRIPPHPHPGLDRFAEHQAAVGSLDWHSALHTLSPCVQTQYI